MTTGEGRTTWVREGAWDGTAAKTRRRARWYPYITPLYLVVFFGTAAFLYLSDLDFSADPGDAARAKAATEVASLGTAVVTHCRRLRTLGITPTLPQTLDSLIHGPADFPGDWGNLMSVRQIPPDPWGNAYVYTYVYTILDPQAGTWEVRCFGADGQPGGAMPYDADIVYAGSPAGPVAIASATD